jgi:hypothetical protein
MPSLPQPPHQSITERHERNALIELIQRLERYIAPIGADEPDWYDWIPLSMTTYLDGMRHIRNRLGPGRRQYLEIGSGIGTKLVLAHALGYHATGIERHAPYVHVSRALAPHCPVIEGDAQHAFAIYPNADIIYNYGIAIDQEHHHQINQLIADRMSPGALYFTPRHPQPDQLEPVAENVWIKP